MCRLEGRGVEGCEGVVGEVWEDWTVNVWRRGRWGR